MSPHKLAAKKSAKFPRHSPNSFRNDDANMAYYDHYKNVSIVMERNVDIESLENIHSRSVQGEDMDQIAEAYW